MKSNTADLHFIGLLGERYGWVPDRSEISERLIEQLPWLAEHFNCSVTELEIIHGVLGQEQTHGQAYFYFRDSKYASRIAEGKEREPFECESSQAAEKLSRLKQRIRNAHCDQVCNLRENYRDLEQLGQWVLKDFTKLIQQRFPKADQPVPAHSQAVAHEVFARRRRVVHVGREASIDQIDTHIENVDQTLMLLGESGLGKSSLLANWLARYCQLHNGDAVFVHFVEASAESSDWRLMLRRFMEELKSEFELPQLIPNDIDEIRPAFANWLNMASDSAGQQGRRIVLVIDALNQLDDRDGAIHLVWLPSVLPEHVRLIVSTLPGSIPEQELSKRGWPTLSLKPLTVSDRTELIHAFLAQHAKRLSEERVRRIADCPQAGNPLYLSALLEELRLSGVHEELALNQAFVVLGMWRFEPRSGGGRHLCAG